jgi:hypothetical protein
MTQSQPAHPIAMRNHQHLLLAILYRRIPLLQVGGSPADTCHHVWGLGKPPDKLSCQHLRIQYRTSRLISCRRFVHNQLARTALVQYSPVDLGSARQTRNLGLEPGIDT